MHYHFSSNRLQEPFLTDKESIQTHSLELVFTQTHVHIGVCVCTVQVSAASHVKTCITVES